MATKDTRGQTHKRSGEEEEPEAVDEQSKKAAEEQQHQEELTDDVNAVLDDIDEALEANAAEFVRSYVQKGGQ